MVRKVQAHSSIGLEFGPIQIKAWLQIQPARRFDPEEILGVIPTDPSIPFDVREIIARLVDGSRFHEFKPRSAQIPIKFHGVQGGGQGVVTIR